MTQQFFSPPTPSPEMTPAPMAASGPSRADKYYFAPKREHIEGADANDKFYSYKDSAWVPRSALPDDAQIILVTHCHDMAGGPCKTLEEACEKNAEYLRAQIEAEQDASSGGGGSAGGLTLEEVKALIAEAVSAHDTDSTAHAATITAAISAAISSRGDTPVDPPSAPVITMADRLPIGRTASVGLSATPAATATIAKFSVTVGDAAAVDVAATDNAGTHTITPSGTAGDTLTVKATATDNLDSVSTEATATAELYDYVMPIYWDYSYSGARSLWRSDNNGMTFAKASDAPTANVATYAISPNRDKVYVCTYDTATGTSKTMRIYCSSDLGATWAQIQEIPRTNICNSLTVTHDATMILSYKQIPMGGGAAAVKNQYSHDGGATWHDIDFGFDIYEIQETSTGDLVARCASIGTRRSRDGGITWSSIGTNVGPKNIMCYYALDNGKIIVVDSSKQQHILTGDTWGTPKTLDWTAKHIIRASDSMILMSGSISTSSAAITRIWDSTNEGGGWYTRKDVGIGSIASLRNFGDGLIIAGGASGKLSRSTDYGMTWATVDTKWPASMVLF